MPDSARNPRNPAAYFEALALRVSLWLLMFFGVVAAVAGFFVMRYGNALDTQLRMAIPFSLIVSTLGAMILMRFKRTRLGVMLIIASVYCSIMAYVVVGGYGNHSYLPSIFALFIVAASLLLGRRSGLWFTLISMATVVVMYLLESRGLMINMHSVAMIPAETILLVYLILFSSMGAIQFVFSRTFHEMLAAAGAQEQRFRQLIDASPLGHVVHRDSVILMVNRIGSGLTGETPEALVGRHIQSFVSRDQRDALNEHMGIARTLPPGKSQTAEYVLVDTKGYERRFDCTTSGVELVDGPALLTVMRDVTRERAAAAALLAAKADAEMANRAKSQFLANMSHEIRTPMNAVLGLSELLMNAGLTGAPLRYAQSIHSSAGSLLGVINDVLDVSRIEAGHLGLAPAPFEPRQMLARVRNTLQPLADAKGLALEISVDDSVPEGLLGDEGRLRQILVNLAGNAVKFTDHGRVRIEMRAVASDVAGEAASRPGGDAGTIQLHLCVRDTGIGIAADKLPTLFERFVQVDDSDTRRYGGSGLGLYIVRELALRMGGDVKAESVVGAGSSFEVTVQLAPAAVPTSDGARADEGTPQRGALPLGRPLSVLLVEDNALNRMVARAMLEGAGHRVTEALDGAEAVALYGAQNQAQPFECILMDAQMPVMDGIEATRRIRAQEAAAAGAHPAAHDSEQGHSQATAHRARHIPIVALTANAMHGDRERYLAAGMDAFLSKPYESADLLRIIQSVAHTPHAPAAATVEESERNGAPDAQAPQPAAALPSFAPQALDGLLRLEETSPGLLQTLVQRFLADTPGLIAQVANASGKPANEVEMAAHSVKGICRRFGAQRAGLLAEQAERAARDGATEELQRLGADLREEFARFERAFREHPAVAAALA